MAAKKKKPAPNADFRATDEVAGDQALEAYIADHRDAIEAKLQKARASIARGEGRPLEPLPELLREARRRAKGAA